MPNWVRNIVQMDGIADLPLFEEKGGGKQFDFEKIIPMPKSLQVEDGSMTDENIVYYLTERCVIPIKCLPAATQGMIRTLVTNCFSDDWPTEVFRRAYDRGRNATEEQREAMYRSGATYIENYLKYGCTTWYTWCRQWWGTKWNACQTQIIDRNTIVFDTAWSNPEPILLKLAEMYPDTEIEHWWADEDMGSNAGHRSINGDCVEEERFDEPHEAYAAYVKCWGESECLYQDEYGNWCRRDCDQCHGCD